jgi:serine/threonine protein kinase
MLETESNPSLGLEGLDAALADLEGDPAAESISRRISDLLEDGVGIESVDIESYKICASLDQDILEVTRDLCGKENLTADDELFLNTSKKIDSWMAQEVVARNLLDPFDLEKLQTMQMERQERDGTRIPLYHLITQAGLVPGPDLRSLVQEFRALDGVGNAVPEVLGPYRVIREIGRGSMGAVFHVQHGTTGEECALKLVLSRGQEKRLKRFQREVMAAKRLEHPNVVRILGSGDVEGCPYLTMELVDGVTMEEVLPQLGPWKGSGPSYAGVPFLEILAQCLDAIECAHQHGIVHRDLKASNILIEKNGRPKILDFGLARILDTAEDGTRITGTGDLVGTPRSMAPEQTLGKYGEIGPGTDIYGMGIILYRAITGRFPFESRSIAALIRQIAGEEPPPPGELNSGLDSALEKICIQSLNKNVHERQSSSQVFADQLRSLLRGETPQVEESSASGKPREQRRKALLIGFVASVLLVLSLWALSGWGGGEVSGSPLSTSGNGNEGEDSTVTLQAARRAVDSNLWSEGDRLLELLDSKKVQIARLERQFLRSRIAFGRNQPLVALEKVCDVISEESENIQALAFRARVYLYLGLDQEAEKDLDRAGSVDSSDPGLEYSKILLQVERGELKAALGRIERSWKRTPHPPLDLVLLKARVLMDLGQWRSTRSLVSEVLKKRPDSGLALWIKARSDLASKVSPAEVMKTLDRAQEVGVPADVEQKIQMERSILLQKMGRFMETIQELQALQARYPEYFRAKMQEVHVYLILGRHKEALRRLHRLQKRYPFQTIVWTVEGEIQSTQRRWKDAEESYQKALQVDPSDVRALDGWVRVRSQRGQWNWFMDEGLKELIKNLESSWKLDHRLIGIPELFSRQDPPMWPMDRMEKCLLGLGSSHEEVRRASSMFLQGLGSSVRSTIQSWSKRNADSGLRTRIETFLEAERKLRAQQEERKWLFLLDQTLRRGAVEELSLLRTQPESIHRLVRICRDSYRSAGTVRLAMYCLVRLRTGEAWTSIENLRSTLPRDRLRYWLLIQEMTQGRYQVTIPSKTTGFTGTSSMQVAKILLDRSISQDEKNQLRTLLGKSEKIVRLAAAGRLALLGDLSGQELLREVAVSGDLAHRRYAVLVLSKLSSSQAASSLVHALGDPDRRVRLIAAVGLFRKLAKESMPGIQGALVGQQDILMGFLLSATLGKFKNQAGQPLFQSLIIDPNVPALTRWGGVLYLKNFQTWPGAARVPGQVGAWRNRAAVGHVLLAAGSGGLSWARKWLKDSDSALRAAAYTALARWGNPKDINQLFLALKDADSSVAVSGARGLALQVQRGVVSIPAIESRLTGAHSQAREAFVRDIMKSYLSWKKEDRLSRLESLTRVAPQVPMIWFERSVILSRIDLAKGIQLLAAAIPQVSRSLECRRVLGNLLYRAKRYKEAGDQYRRALKVDPIDGLSLYGLGRVMEKQGQYSKAQDLFERASLADPLDSRFQLAVIQMLLLQGEMGQASKSIHFQIRFFPQSGPLQYLAASIHARRGRARDRKKILDHLVLAKKNGYRVSDALKAKEFNFLYQDSEFQKICR